MTCLKRRPSTHYALRRGRKKKEAGNDRDSDHSFNQHDKKSYKSRRSTLFQLRLRRREASRENAVRGPYHKGIHWHVDQNECWQAEDTMTATSSPQPFQNCQRFKFHFSWASSFLEPKWACSGPISGTSSIPTAGWGQKTRVRIPRNLKTGKRRENAWIYTYTCRNSKRRHSR